MEYIGINNENEFYSQHYLDEIFEGEVADLIKEENAKVKAIDAELKEAKKKGLEGPHPYKTEWDKLSAVSKFYIQSLYELGSLKDEDELLSLEKEQYKRLLEALGFSPVDDNSYKEFILYDSGIHLPLVKEIKTANGSPYLWIFHASTLGASEDISSKEEIDPLELTIPVRQVLNFLPDYKGVAKELSTKTWREILEKGVFSQEYCPRWIILVSPYQWVLIERTKFAQRRFLRFNWQQLLSRRENHILQATSILIDSNAFKLNEGVCRLENFDENSFKHAQGVSQDLKYAMRRSIELLGNEAVSQIRQKRERWHEKFFSDDKLASELTSELLRYMYRLLFIFYVEARPELNYVPNKDDNYQTSYSLESLRDLESVPLISKEDREGKYFHKTISNLFSFLSKGVGQENKDYLAEQYGKFTIEKLNSKLFDDRNLNLLKDVAFPNYILQQIIRWMSLANFSDCKGKNKRSGRISYAHLGVNQLGAVYEALLSYQGFFADEDLYEVKKSDVKEVNELDPAYFVKESELVFYKDSEKVYEKDSFSGENRLKKHPKGSFIYRMAGRSRETSASYYTPEVLTKCVVQHSIEVLEQQQLSQLPDPKSKAEKILTWRVCEPAMGSAAFLNEATNQLAELYMKYAMKIPGAAQLTQTQYREELQKVKMYIADRNLYGVDLNPTAVELGEVSVWLNALSADRFVPSFEGQLLCGNSLIGCRREVYYASDLAKSIKTAKTHPVGPNGLQDGEIWHFLVPSDGMALYGNNDADIKKIVPEELKQISVWRKNFNAKFTDEELLKLQLLSSQIESHWRSYAAKLAEVRDVTTNNYSIYQHQDKNEKDFLNFDSQQEIFKQIQDKDDIFEFGEFPRLRTIMNYWCSLWFWPIEKMKLLPSRKEFINDVFAQLNAIKEAPQVQLKGQTDLLESIAPVGFQTDLFDTLESQNPVNDAEHNPRIKIVHDLTSKLHFFHWPLRFADFFLPREDNHIGFDLTLGNPPWSPVTFESKKILGDLDPKYVIHDKDFNAKSIQDVLLGTNDLIDGKSLFDRIPRAKGYWLESCEIASGSKNFFNDDKLYPELKGSGTDLFKLFLPNIWRNSAVDGVQGILHPETPYTETNAITLRECVYHRVNKHFSFTNQLKLFADVHHETEFSVNVYGKYHEDPDFITISNLFIPKTISDSQKPSDYEVEGIKDSEGKWNTQGHPERILHIDKKVFDTISKVFSTNPKAPILPNIHATSLLSILEHFSDCRRLCDYDNYISRMWDETNAQKDGTIKAIDGNHTVFPSKSEDVILNGGHLFVGNPLFKIPNDPCNNNLQWSSLDLTIIPDDYLPRCKYLPKVDRDEYEKRMDHESWSNQAVFDLYRIAYRGMVGCDLERTLTSAIIPPGFTHINGMHNISLNEDIISIAAVFSSIVTDFYVRTIGKTNLQPGLIRSIPIPKLTSAQKEKLIIRTLSLNCLTSQYKTLWKENYLPSSMFDSWSSEVPGLRSSFFSALTVDWQRNNSLRTDIERRQALLEIDVIVAQAFGLTLHELQTCYRLGFRVMRSYEEDTYYDQIGRIIYTKNSSLGIGIPSKAKKESDVYYAVNGAVKENGLGFDEVKEMDSGTVTKTFMDDTLPGGPQQRTITYYAPFFKKDRVADYAQAWHYFENL